MFPQLHIYDNADSVEDLLLLPAVDLLSGPLLKSANILTFFGFGLIFGGSLNSLAFCMRIKLFSLSIFNLFAFETNSLFVYYYSLISFLTYLILSIFVSNKFGLSFMNLILALKFYCYSCAAYFWAYSGVITGVLSALPYSICPSFLILNLFCSSTSLSLWLRDNNNLS